MLSLNPPLQRFWSGARLPHDLSLTADRLFDQGIQQSSLFLVPFAALQGKDGKYLIEKHTILTAPSIQVLQLTREQRQRLGATHASPLQGNDALVVGNPIMPSVPPAPGEKPQQLPSLPGAEEEAVAIAPLLNTKAIIGKDATKSAIVQLLPKARIIHLATHGILDDIRGIGSAIASFLSIAIGSS
jgi:CHAT domain-containing protein